MSDASSRPMLEAMKRFIAQGYTLVAVGVDIAALGDAARATVRTLRG